MHSGTSHLISRYNLSQLISWYNLPHLISRYNLFSVTAVKTQVSHPFSVKQCNEAGMQPAPLMKLAWWLQACVNLVVFPHNPHSQERWRWIFVSPLLRSFLIIVLTSDSPKQVICTNHHLYLGDDKQEKNTTDVITTKWVGKNALGVH